MTISKLRLPFKHDRKKFVRGSVNNRPNPQCLSQISLLDLKSFIAEKGSVSRFTQKIFILKFHFKNQLYRRNSFNLKVIRGATSFCQRVTVYILQKTYFPHQNQASGSAKASGREPKTGLGRVFNYKLGCYDDVHVIMYTDVHQYLQLKSRPRFRPVS